MKNVLIADDDESVAWVLEKFFKEKAFEPTVVKDGISAEKAIKSKNPSIALLDINMPGKDGLTLLKEIKGETNALIIIMTGESALKNAIDAMKGGAFDYITKPIDLDELDVIVKRAEENIKLRGEVVTLKEKFKEHLLGDFSFIGKSKPVEKVFKIIGKIAHQDVTVLIQGESGTGKELIARLIHINSPRSSAPFIAVNSAAIPKDLMESELFGHEKGAFTGAIERKPGKFELADGGVIFLDEVGDMDINLQAKVLRAIQEHEFYRVGGREPVKVDVRVIAATNQNLEKMVEEKRFREDLYFRLNVVMLNLPPLRERKGDVSILANYFLEKFAAEFGAGRRMFSKKALEALEDYDWPGNVRELENIIRRSLLLSPNATLTDEDMALPRKRHKKESIEDMITSRLEPFVEKTSLKGRQELYDTIMPFMERPLIKLMLKKVGFNQVKAAEVLGINRNTLRKKIRELKISIKDGNE